MAKDVVVLLDYMGWIGKRQLHVVGISLGGMIAQGKRGRGAPGLLGRVADIDQNSPPAYQSVSRLLPLASRHQVVDLGQTFHRYGPQPSLSHQTADSYDS